MKKALLLLVCVFSLFAVSMKADNERVITVNQLPAAAQTFLKKNFADAKIAVVRVETDFLEKVYDVVFTNGNSIEFNRKGEWKEVDCKFDGVPSQIVPAAISKYVTENYPDAKIWKIELDKSDKEYELQLSNRWELKFNLDGVLTHLEND